MKTYIHLLFLSLILTVGLISCQNEDQISKFENQLKTKSITEDQMLAPLNVIPEWVKEKVTADEYAMLTLISTKFRVNYSFLQDVISVKRWEEIDGHLSRICQDIESGRYVEGSSWVLAIASEHRSGSLETRRLERLSSPETGVGEESRSKSTTVYTTSYDVSLQVTVLYTYNIQNGIASNVSASARAVSSVPSRNPSFGGMCGADYNTGTKRIQGACSGTLSFALSPNYIENITIQNQQFLIVP